MFGWKAAIPVWAAPIHSHLSLFLAVTGENTMAKQLCKFLRVMEFSEESSGMDSVHRILGWDPPRGSGVWKAQTQRVASVTARELNRESGTIQDQDNPGQSRRSHPHT